MSNKENLVISSEVKERFEILKSEGRVLSYDNSIAKDFKAFLDYIEYPYEAEDCGGGSLAPEMWRFTKIEDEEDEELDLESN